jgi:hypothetical protein
MASFAFVGRGPRWAEPFVIESQIDGQLSSMVRHVVQHPSNSGIELIAHP